MELTGIILSGGKSSRMGKEKGMCLLQGKPLIEYSFDLLKKFCDSIIISSSSNDYQYLGCQIVKDEIQGIGPAGGIYSCLRASGNDENFIISCDMPMITGDLIQYLLSQKKDFDALIPLFNGFPEPLCAFYRQSCIPVFKKSIDQGKYKLQDIIKGVNAGFVPVKPTDPFYSPLLFTNLNTPGDISDLESRLQIK
jgi:molybdopterin-guanine dinucleotide biosynthesis protein A